MRFDICWRLAEAEAALIGFPVIEPAHFWIGVCKAVELRQKTSRHKTQEKRDGRANAEERITTEGQAFSQNFFSTFLLRPGSSSP